MAQQDYKFEGWLGLDEKADQGNMVWREFEPKPWEETDIDIEVTHSGICGSDLHALRSGWGPMPYPVCVGHEIVGRAVRVGSRAEGGIKVGDLVGVGAQADSCLGRLGSACADCASGSEQYCPRPVHTYGSLRHYNGGKAMGGHATHHRCPSHFVVPIPAGLDPALAAPMLCGGVTVYSPLRHHGAGPGKTVGIVGVGGLGHFGVLFARALGADRVVGISRRADKRDEVLRMGADEYIATDDDAGWEARHARTLDVVIMTVSSSRAPLASYLGLVRRDGALVQVGNPDDGAYSLHPLPLIAGRVSYTGSAIGSPAEIREMLALAVDKGVRPWVEQRPMRDANRAMADMLAGKARYRYVLVN
ncbi:uncharacterized protein E0L32_004216 [Thyridium curvatum]|uniref:alcohol dehydrogenase (NADP(+)) n=1 Tax=Thyridium curvatum TaxID=1093900 RepID=A0A507BGV2_9PEZI|nr:uncharacterized protein E0L32_004216 [Thyridium curvatum]TPX16221.1 hypothetical protein E0L32_004216 [Thyridium curvatum]